MLIAYVQTRTMMKIGDKLDEISLCHFNQLSYDDAWYQARVSNDQIFFFVICNGD